MNFQPIPGMHQDTRWHEISASLRHGVLWVKIPRSRVERIVKTLEQVGEDLLRKIIYENKKSFIFLGPIAEWNEDLQTLERAASKDPTGALAEFARAIAAGLRNDPDVDWISRIGGPAREDAEALEALQSADPETDAGEEVLVLPDL